MSKKHILVISQYFYPEQFRINDICQEWVKRGYQVTVLTGIPNYPEGKFYSGYGYTKKRKERWNGIDIIRIPLFPRGKKSIGLILNYLSFVVSGWVWTCFTKTKADIVFTFEVSPMTQALIGVWYSKKFKIPNYLYVQDLWPENVEIVTGISSPIIIAPINRMVNYIYKNCNKIFATSPSFTEKIRKVFPYEKERVIYWPQYAEDFYSPMEEKSSLIPQDGVLNITFTGNIGSAQGLEILPDTAKILKEKNVKVRFNIVGEGRNKNKLIESIKKNTVEEYFNILGQYPATKIPSILASSDMAFVSFSNNVLYAMTIPAKIQSYMACGIPILASACGETSRIIKEAKCGYVSEIGRSDKLAEAILNILEISEHEKIIMKNNALYYYNSHFNKNKLHQQILKEMNLL